MRNIIKIRLFIHHIGIGMATLGVYMLFLTVHTYPTLLDVATNRMWAVIYLTLYPILVALVLVEDILLLFGHKIGVKL